MQKKNNIQRNARKKRDLIRFLPKKPLIIIFQRFHQPSLHSIYGSQA